MVWRELKNHHKNCYFCMVDNKEINQNNRRKWIYPNLESAKWPTPHSNEVPVPVFDHLPELTESSDKSSSYVDAAMSCSGDSENESTVATLL